MKVLFLINLSEGSGIYIYGRFLAEQLRREGIEVDIDKPKHKDYDLIHVHNAYPIDFIKTKLKLVRCPVICTTHMTPRELEGLMPKTMVKLSRHYIKFFYKRCAKIICSSMRIKNDVDTNMGLSDRTVFLMNSIDTSKFHRDEKLGEEFLKKYSIDKKMVLCVASIQKRKGVFDFVKIAKSLPQYQFVWTGTIPDVFTLREKEKIEKIANGTTENLIFTGGMPHNELRSAYSAADLFLSPTFSETFGLTLVESATAGLPVLARKIEDFEMFRDFIVTFDSVADAKEKTIELLENKELRNKHSKAGLEFIKKVSPEKHVEKILEIYNEVLANNPKKNGFFFNNKH